MTKKKGDYLAAMKKIQEKNNMFNFDDPFFFEIHQQCGCFFSPLKTL